MSSQSLDDLLKEINKQQSNQSKSKSNKFRINSISPSKINRSNSKSPQKFESTNFAEKAFQYNVNNSHKKQRKKFVFKKKQEEQMTTSSDESSDLSQTSYDEQLIYQKKQQNKSYQSSKMITIDEDQDEKKENVILVSEDSCNSNMFSSIYSSKQNIFVFLKISSECSQQRINLFEQNIAKYLKGSVFMLGGFLVTFNINQLLTFNQINENNSQNCQRRFLICGKDVSIQQARQEMQQFQIQEATQMILLKNIIACEYIVECLKYKKIIDFKQFLQFPQLSQNIFNQNNNNKQDLQTIQQQSNQQINQIINQQNSVEQYRNLNIQEEQIIQEQKQEEVQKISKNCIRHSDIKKFQRSQYQEDKHLWDYDYEDEEEEIFREQLYYQDHTDQDLKQHDSSLINYDNLYGHNFDDEDLNSEDEYNMQKFGIVDNEFSQSHEKSRKSTPVKFYMKLSTGFKNSEQNQHYQEIQTVQINNEDNQQNNNKDKNLKTQQYHQQNSFQKIEVKIDNQEKSERQGDHILQQLADDDCQIIEVRPKKQQIQICSSNSNKKATVLEGVSKQMAAIDLESNDHEIQQQILKQQLQKLNEKNNQVTVITKPVISGLKRRHQYWDQRKDKFQFIKGAPAIQDNPNSFITDELEKLQKIYASDKYEHWRAFAYRKAIQVIKSYPHKIQSVKDVQNLNGIGDKILKKIKEIIETGELQKAKNMSNNEKYKVLQLFCQVWGIGESTADHLYSKGIRTIAQLRKNQGLLNKNQIIGLYHYEDLQQRIPRDEVKEIVERIENVVRILENIPQIYEVIPCGSYRRGKETCGDVDILLCRKDGQNSNQHNFMQQLIAYLSETDKILTDHLIIPKISSHGSETYMGIGKVRDIHRRIDIKLYPREQYGFAVLYFTGSDLFNRSMRLFARKKGYSLSDHGMALAQHTNNQKVWQGESIACFSEFDVFQVLGVNYIKPEDRNI